MPYSVIQDTPPRRMAPVTLIDDIAPPAPAMQAYSQSMAPAYNPRIYADPTPAPAPASTDDVLHELRQIKYISIGLAIAIFFILLTLMLKRN